MGDKTTSAPSRRSRTDIAFIAVRVLLVADIILTFVPSVNPARISSMINRNLSLFTCGISLSEMSTIKQLINIKEAAAAFAATAAFIGRGDGTRTHGLFVPNEVNNGLSSTQINQIVKIDCNHFATLAHF